MIYTSFHMQQYLPVWITRKNNDDDDDEDNDNDNNDDETKRTEKKGYTYKEDASCQQIVMMTTMMNDTIKDADADAD